MKKLKTQILLWMLVIVVPLLAILITYNVYTLKVLNKQVASNNEEILSIYEKPIEKNIDYISYLMASLLANDADMLRLNYVDNYLDAYVCCNNVSFDYKTIMNSKLEGLRALGICQVSYGITKMVYAENAHYTYSEKSALREAVEAQMQSQDSYKAGWQLIQAAEKNYLLRILKNNQTYVMIVFDFSLFSTPQDETDQTPEGYMLYASADNVPLTMQDFVKDNAILLKDFDGKYYITEGNENRFMVVEKDFPYAGVKQFYVSPYRGNFQYLDYMQVLLFIMTFTIACVVPLGFHYMKKTLFNPLESLTTTMTSIGNGQTEMRMEEEYNIEEFIQMKDSFNIMIDKIEQLKISAYEQELQLKNVQMQYFQIQIRPHFFLNCLKNIYALAEQRECEKIQEMILALSQYLRSMFKNNPMLVTLREEIAGVENYILLQKMCQSNPPECRINIVPELMGQLIPPLSIITFLENSVKHGGQNGKKLMISIKGTKLVDEHTSFMCITILDNGPGFSEQMLRASKGEYDGDGKAHVGIMNVKERFEMLYHGKAMILFSNSNGACVELYIPIE